MTICCLAAVALHEGPVLAADVLGVTAAPIRGGDIIRMAEQCRAEYGPGTRVCTTEDLLAPGAITLPTASADTSPRFLVLPSIRGAVIAGPVTTVDATGIAGGTSPAGPQCIVITRSLVSGSPTDSFAIDGFNSPTCTQPNSVACCRD
jgi:hypothetical protein